MPTTTLPAHRKQNATDLRAWKKAGVDKAELKRRTDTFSALDTQLQKWREEGFIAPGWALEWDSGCGDYRVRFRMIGTEHPPYSFTATEFELYARGFHDRRKAVMHRTPRH